jgi:glycosyltransferase involved in cell wall biosynthesis
MLYGKPILTNRGTEISKIVEARQTGFLVDENMDSLQKVLNEIDIDAIAVKGKNASNLFEEYKDINKASYIRAFK